MVLRMIRLHVHQDLYLAVLMSQCALFVAQLAIRSPTGKAALPPPCAGSPTLQDAFGVVAATLARA
jgi:hypothetical protein